MRIFVLMGLLAAPSAFAIELNVGDSVWLRPNAETLVSCGADHAPLLRCGPESDPSCASNYSGGRCLLRGGRDVGSCVQSGVDESNVAKCKCI